MSKPVSEELSSAPVDEPVDEPVYWAGLGYGAMVAVTLILAIAIGWIFIGIPTLIGVGWNNTSAKANAAALTNLRTQTQNGFAEQNNAVQQNFVLNSQLPPGTVNIGGTNGVANALRLSGDVSMNPDGVVTISQGAVTNSQMANPAQYIVSFFPGDLPPVPIWYNSIQSEFSTGTLGVPFPYGTVSFAVSIVTRSIPSQNSVPATNGLLNLINTGANNFQLILTQDNVLQLFAAGNTVTPVVEAPVPPIVANRVPWTIYSFAQQLTPSGWTYTIYADDLILASETPFPFTLTPKVSAPSNDEWIFMSGSSAEIANVYIFNTDAADPLGNVLTTVDLRRLVILGPGNTFTSKVGPYSFASYEFYNTPGYPVVDPSVLIQSLDVGRPTFTNQNSLSPGPTYTLYQNVSCAMLLPERLTSFFANFNMPGNVSSINVTIVVEVVKPQDYVSTNSLPLSLMLYGATVSQGSQTIELQVTPTIAEQTLVVTGIPTTANTEIGQKWTVELLRDGETLTNQIYIGVESLVVQGIVA